MGSGAAAGAVPYRDGSDLNAPNNVLPSQPKIPGLQAGLASTAATAATAVDPTVSEAGATGRSVSDVQNGVNRVRGLNQNIFTSGFGLLDDPTTRRAKILGF